MPSFKFTQKPIKHPIDVALNVVVGHSTDAIAHAFEVDCPSGVIRDFLVASVCGAINLDNQLALAAHEVDEVCSNRRLTKKLETRKPTAAQLLRELLFCTNLT